METLTKRQVGQTPALLWATAERCAAEGQAVYVLHKGKPAYRIEYIGDEEPDPLAELERLGILERANPNPAPIPEPGTPLYTREQVEELTAWVKGDR